MLRITKLILAMIVSSVIVLAGADILSTGRAQAAQNGNVSIQPTTPDPRNPLTRSWFIYDFAPGVERKDSVTVINQTDKPLKVKVYPTDASTTKDGAFTMGVEGAKPTDVGAWITLPVSELTLKAKEHRTIPFKVKVPRNALIGDHAGGIIIQEVVPKETFKEGYNVNIISRVGVRVYLNVAGAQRSALSIHDFKRWTQGTDERFSFVVKNEGNVFLQPKGEIAIYNFLGQKVRSYPVEQIGLVTLNTPIQKQLSNDISFQFGYRKAVLTVEYPGGRQEALTHYFCSPSYLLVVLGIAGLYILIKRRRHGSTH